MSRILGTTRAESVIRELVDAGMMMADPFTTEIHRPCACPRCGAGQRKFAAIHPAARELLRQIEPEEAK